MKHSKPIEKVSNRGWIWFWLLIGCSVFWYSVIQVFN